MSCSKWGLVALWFIVIAQPRAIAELSQRGILILDESDSRSPISRRIINTIHSTLDAETKQNYSLYPEYLDMGHFNIQAYEPMLHTFLNNKYHNTKIDIIVALGSEALKFALRMREDTWPAVPIVFLAFDKTLATGSIRPPNLTGTIAVRSFDNLVKSARLLVPHLRRLVLAGDPLKDQPMRHEYYSGLQEAPKDLDVIDLSDLSFPEVLTRVAALPDDAAIIYMPIFTDETGYSHNPNEALKALADVANRPIVVDSDTLIGTGAAGGFVQSTEGIGREVARQVGHILDGIDPFTIPIAEMDFTKPIFDYRQLNRFGISKLTLPADSELRFREIGVWERYRQYILIIIAIGAIQTVVIAWLIYEHRRRRVAEHKAQQHLLDVTRMDRAMSASVISASVAHELKQPLAAIFNNAEAAEILLNANPLDRDELKDILKDILRDDQRAVEIIDHLRKLLGRGELQQNVIALTDVINDTLALIKSYAERQGTTLVVEPLPANMWVRADPVHLQQVLLNLAINAMDAMQSIPVSERQLILGIRQRDAEATVSVADTGPGIPWDKLKNIFEPFVTTKDQGTGLGLSIARTIINAYDGVIWAENNASRGAIFYFTLGLVQPKAV